MMTQRKIAAGGDGKKLMAYLREATTIEDANRKLAQYYGGWDARGTWRRDMAPEIVRALGIDRYEPPSDLALERLFEGRRADDGEKWTKEKREISAVDIQTAPHKSVTEAIILAESEAERASLLQAVWRANDYALHAFAGRLAVARTGKGGSKGLVPGDVAWCSFMHFTARPTHVLQDGPDGKTEVKGLKLPSDPHIHIHNPFFNLLHCDDGVLRAIDFGQLRHIKEFGGIFQAKLADELRALGVRVRYDEDEQAVVVDAIPDALSLMHSKGRENTLVKAKAAAREQGLAWDDLPRARKHKLLNDAAQRKIHKQDGRGDQERWVAEAREAGFNHTTCLTGEPPLSLTPAHRIDQASGFLARHLAKEFETAAVIDLEVMRSWAARSLIGVGMDSPKDVNDVIQAVNERGIDFDGKTSRLILGRSRGKIRVTHTVQLELEQSVQSLARAMGQDWSRGLSAEAAEQALAVSGIDFRGEVGRQQRDAALAMMRGPALVYLEGLAGVGKTTRVLPACVQGWQADGRHVIGLSQAWRQTDDLADAGIAERYALTPFLKGVKDGTIVVGENTVLVLDETAQVSPIQFVELQRLWMRHGTVVRSMGDREQTQAIQAGSAAEIIARPNRLGEAALPIEALPSILETVRQSTPEQRRLATSFRNGEAMEAIQFKREDGSARLIGGDYDQVVARQADRYLELRDWVTTLRNEAEASGDTEAMRRWGKGTAIYTLTNADAAAISRHVRRRLQDRGEIARQEAVYQAIDNRGAHYDLPVAVGDRHRLFKKVFGRVNGVLRSVGSNGDVVEVLGQSDQGLTLKTKAGDVAEVRWSSLKDQETDRLKMGYGHCLTIDAAQGMTAAVTIHALPRGSAGETAFKAYVGESRHTEFCETLIAEAAIRQAVQSSRPLGDSRPITEDDLWQRVGKDMAERPTKSLAMDLLSDVLNDQEALIDDLLRLDRTLQANPRRDFAAEIFGRVNEIRLRDALEPQIANLETVIHRRTDILEGLRDHLADTLRELRTGYLPDDPGPTLNWFNRPGVEPSI